MTKKSIVLVAHHSYFACEVNEHHCTLLEIEELATTKFLFGDGSPETIFLSTSQRDELLRNKKLVVDEKMGLDQYPEQNEFIFTIIDVLVSEEGSYFLKPEDLVGQGNFSKKSDAYHIIRRE